LNIFIIILVKSNIYNDKKMIVHAQVFEVKYRTSLADFTLPYQTNPDLDYEFIAEKCKKLVEGI